MAGLLRMVAAFVVLVVSVVMSDGDSGAAPEASPGRVAWSTSEQYNASGRIFVAEMDGSAKWSPGHGRTLKWSPDGSRLLVQTRSALGVVDVATHSMRSLLPLKAADWITAMFWSSDGRRVLAEVAHDLDDCHVQRFLVTADGASTARRISLPSGYLLDWSEDGGRALFLATNRCAHAAGVGYLGDAPPPASLVLLALDGSDRVVLARNVTRRENAAIVDAAWSDHDTSVAFTRCFAVPGGELACTVWTTQAGAAPKLVVDITETWVYDPIIVWTSQGELVYGVRTRGLWTAVMASDPVTGSRRRLLKNVDFPGNLTFSADSSRLAFVTGLDAQTKVVVADLQTMHRSRYNLPHRRSTSFTEIATDIALWLR